MIGETVTVLTAPTTEDRYTNAVPNWAAASSVDVDGCALAPRLAPEDRGGGRQGVIVGYTLYAPAGTVIEPTDRVIARGRPFEVDGEIGDWRNPFSGTAFGIEVALRRVEG